MDEQGGMRPTSWALRVGRGLLGVPVSLHWTLLVMPVVLYFVWAKQDQSAGEVVRHGRLFLTAAVQTVLLVIFVYLHELGHALAGLRTRTPVPEIMLTPLGGAALMGQRLRSPNHEVVVAMAGPLITLMLMGLFYAGYHFGLHEWLGRLTGSSLVEGFYLWGLWVNAAMGLFNLLPMIPLDGGKTFRAFLAFKLEPGRATQTAATVGQVLAVGLGVVGIYLLVTAGGILPMLLIFLAMWGFASCIQERMLAREGMVYVEGDYGYGDESESWKVETASPPKPGWWARWMERRRQERQKREEQEERAFRERVDALLAKVKRDGMDSLTKAERRVLEEASARFRKEKNGRD